VPRAELSAVVAERNRWKEKHRALEARLAEIESQVPSEDQLQSLEDFRERAEKLAADNKQLSETLTREKADLEGRLKRANALAERLVVEQAVADAAARLDAFRPHLVAKLLADRFKADTSGETTRIVPLSPDGSEALGADGSRVTVEEVVAAFMAENDFLAKSGNPGGAGSASAPAHGKPSHLSPEDIAGMTSRQRKALLRRRRGEGALPFRW